MYIEVLHDVQGKILCCYCADTLPEAQGEPLFRPKGELPEGVEQARINIDTVMAMEIDQACGAKPVIDTETGMAAIAFIHRPQYIMDRFAVNTASEVAPLSGVRVPQGIKLRTLVRK